MTIPYSKVVLVHKVMFILMWLDLLSYSNDWYAFTSTARYIAGLLFLISLFKINWDRRETDRSVFVIKVIAETILVLWIGVFALGSQLGYSDTVATSKSYRLRMEGGLGQGGPAGLPFYHLYRSLGIVERLVAYYHEPEELPFANGKILSVTQTGSGLDLKIDWGNDTTHYVFKRL